jgi:zinc transport system substrate-binding protein
MKTLEITALKSKILFFCTMFALIHTVALSGISYSDTDVPGKLTIYVVNYPLKYFAERIAGDHAKVVFPAPSEGDPAFWIPDIQAISAYQQADLILLNGATYAKWITKVSLPRSKIVDTSKSFRDRYIVVKGAGTHSHGARGEHSHAGTAFTTWLDFNQAVKQAQAVAKAMERKRPELVKTFEKNLAALVKDLNALDENIQAIVSRAPAKPLVASHPVYQYFARRYGLNLKPVLWEPEEIPNDKQLLTLQNILKDHPAKWMLWEGQPAKASVEKLEIVGMHSLVFDPCGNTPDQGDFMSIMRRNVENLKTAFQ